MLKGKIGHVLVSEGREDLHLLFLLKAYLEQAVYTAPTVVATHNPCTRGRGYVRFACATGLSLQVFFVGVVVVVFSLCQ